MLPIKQELEQRGLLKQYTDEKIFEMIDRGGMSFYFGVDPSADSMTIGNLIALMQAMHIMLRGNKCFLLVGGATGMIGNPSGKDSERNFLDIEQLNKNQAGISNNFKTLVTNIENLSNKKLSCDFVNNYDWFKNMSYLNFLREVGKYMTVNWMMNKDIVRKRISDPDKSISYAEFSYMLIMGYDFAVLAKEHDVVLEVGGSDERDGILAGIEITRKLYNKEVHGITNNLILDSSGRKFGKSEGNAIWLDPAKNSPYFVYQYFMNTADADVSRYLKLFTLLEFVQIDEIVAKHMSDPSLRYGQSQLAYLVCQIIFGTKSADIARQVSQFMFADDKMQILSTLDTDTLSAIYTEVGTTKYDDDIISMAVDSGLCASRGEAKKLLEQNGLKLDMSDNIGILSKGKKTFRIVLK